MTHEVCVLCNCDEVPCRMEVYISDVRIAATEVQKIRDELEWLRSLWVPTDMPGVFAALVDKTAA